MPAGFLNSLRLKGIHLAMRTGMLAAEAAFAAVRAGDTSAGALAPLPAPHRRGSGPRGALSGAQRSPGVRARAVRRDGVRGPVAVDEGPLARDLTGHAGHTRMRTLDWYSARTCRRRRPSGARPSIGRLTFDRLTNVHYSGTSHREDQPSHLLVRHDAVHHRSAAPNTATRASDSARRRSTRSRTDADGHAAPADQRRQLRSLQDVRHHGPLSGDHLGAARRRGRPAVQRHVECRGADDD